MSARHSSLNLTLTRMPARPLAEFVLYAPDRAAEHARDWIAPPGHVEAGPDGQPLRLQFAPRRWLLVADDARLQERMSAAEHAGIGVRTDVEGKWEAMVLDGEDAVRALSSTVDVAGILAGRGCAVVTLFDCPAIVQRAGAGFRLWVASSCAQAFADAIGRLAS